RASLGTLAGALVARLASLILPFERLALGSFVLVARACRGPCGIRGLGGLERHAHLGESLVRERAAELADLGLQAAHRLAVVGDDRGVERGPAERDAQPALESVLPAELERHAIARRIRE